MHGEGATSLYKGHHPYRDNSENGLLHLEMSALGSTKAYLKSSLPVDLVKISRLCHCLLLLSNVELVYMHHQNEFYVKR